MIRSLIRGSLSPRSNPRRYSVTLVGRWRRCRLETDRFREPFFRPDATNTGGRSADENAAGRAKHQIMHTHFFFAPRGYARGRLRR